MLWTLGETTHLISIAPETGLLDYGNEVTI